MTSDLNHIDFVQSSHPASPVVIDLLRLCLMAGASTAGPTLAYWLHQYGFEVTFVSGRPEDYDLVTAAISIRSSTKTD